MDILSIYNHKPFFLQFFFSLHPEQQQWSTFLRSASSSSPQQHPVVPQRSRQGASALQGRAFLFPVLQYHPQSIMKTHLHHCFYNHTRLVQSWFFLVKPPELFWLLTACIDPDDASVSFHRQTVNVALQYPPDLLCLMMKTWAGVFPAHPLPGTVFSRVRTTLTHSVKMDWPCSFISQ